VLHEKGLAEYRTEATGEPDPSTAVLFANYSWHWDVQNPAGNPIQIATLSHSAQASLPRNEFDLLAEALSSTERPLRHAVKGQDRRVPLVCSHSPSYPRPTTSLDRRGQVWAGQYDASPMTRARVASHGTRIGRMRSMRGTFP
jgi:hypothetical protein